MRSLVVTRAGLPELSTNGMREVRMICMTRVCVSSDSTNHPVWNRAGYVHALNTKRGCRSGNGNLRMLGIKHISLASGDRLEVAKVIADRLGMDTV